MRDKIKEVNRPPFREILDTDKGSEAGQIPVMKDEEAYDNSATDICNRYRFSATQEAACSSMPVSNERLWGSDRSLDLALLDFIKTKSQLESEEIDFARSVAKSLEKLPDRTRHLAKAKIMQLLYEMHEQEYRTKEKHSS